MLGYSAKGNDGYSDRARGWPTVAAGPGRESPPRNLSGVGGAGIDLGERRRQQITNPAEHAEHDPDEVYPAHLAVRRRVPPAQPADELERPDRHGECAHGRVHEHEAEAFAIRNRLIDVHRARAVRMIGGHDRGEEP